MKTLFNIANNIIVSLILTERVIEMNEHKRIERLMLFVELAKQLNFTKASEALGISKGYLSEQIKRLETELECPLLIRTTRSVRLTQQGERAYSQGLAIRAQMLSLERSVLHEHEEITGVLRITAPKMFAEIYLFDICAQFRSIHPEIRFEINSSYTTYNLNQHDIDLAFRATNTPPEDMVAEKLFTYEHILVASPEYLSSHGMPNTHHDLKTHQCLATLHQQIWPLKSQDIQVSGWITTNENHLLKQQAISGHGIFRVADYYVQAEIEKRLLQPVLPAETSGLTNAIYLFYPQVIYPALRLKTFVNFVQSYFKQ